MPIADLLFALDDATRRTVYETVVAAETSVGDLAKRLRVSAAAISKHLKILREAGLVAERRQGRLRLYGAVPGALDELASYVLAMQRPPAPDIQEERDLLSAFSEMAGTDSADYGPEFFLIAFRIDRIARYTEEAIAIAAAGIGLNRGQMFLLEALKRKGPPYTSTPTELQSITWVSLAGVGKQLDQLEAGGYVERVVNPSDRRGSLVHLTKKGRRATERSRRAGMSSPHFKALTEMGPARRREFALMLERFQHLIERWRDQADDDVDNPLKNTKLVK